MEKTKCYYFLLSIICPLELHVSEKAAVYDYICTVLDKKSVITHIGNTLLRKFSINCEAGFFLGSLISLFHCVFLLSE